MDNAHVKGDSKSSFTRDTSRTYPSPRKSSVQAPQQTRKPDPRTRKDRPSCLQCGTAAKANTALNTQFGAGQHDLTEVIKQSMELESRNQKLVDEKKDLQASVNVERERMRREQMEAEKQIRDLQGKNQNLEDELNILKGTLHFIQDKHLHTVKLLEERTADLKGTRTQPLLTTLDHYAGAEILKMVEALNAEIFQGAALVAELLGDGIAFEVDEPRKIAQLTRDDRDYLTQFIGPKLIQHLSTKSKQVQVDPFPLQLAAQAILTSWCVFMVDSFYPERASGDLKKMYRRIWESGRRSRTFHAQKHVEF